MAIGFALSAGFLGLLLGLDIAGRRQLVLETTMGWLAGVMIFMSNGIVFAGVLLTEYLGEVDPFRLRTRRG